VDGDGNIDVLSASSKIIWYKNDGMENFTPHTITTNVNSAQSVYALDMDDDGDIDVLSASSLDNKIAWYENDGNENFTFHTITTDADIAHSVYAVDVDGDGDIDVLSASFVDDKIAWYENLSFVTSVLYDARGVPDKFLLYYNYPNPFNPTTTIAYDLPKATNVVLKIYDVLGNEVRTLLNTQQQAGYKSVVWDGRDDLGLKVSSGIFMYRLRAGDLVQTKKMILLK